MKNYNPCNCGNQDNDNEKLDNMMFFKENSGIAGKQDYEASYGKGYIYVIISPLIPHCDIVDEENIV